MFSQTTSPSDQSLRVSCEISLYRQAGRTVARSVPSLRDLRYARTIQARPSVDHAHLLVRQPDPGGAPQPGAVVVGFEAGRADAVGGELLVAVLGVAGDPDGTDDFARAVADLQSPAFGKDLIAAGAHEIPHEDRPLLGARLHQLGGAAHGQCRVSLSIRHFEPDHGAAVLLL